MNDQDILNLQKAANAIRVLSMDAIEAANSGHPGLPMGCAEIGAYLYGHAMRHNPKNPHWLGRDRFFLSAGHGSMLLYSCLHLSGYDLPLEELKKFRQLDSMTPGHPEYKDTPGVETTTGPLGQGMANAVGVALANKMAAARLKMEALDLVDGLSIGLVGDGCMMEGITNEAACLAGHLQLDNLIVFYDSNDICLDGPTEECFSEDTAKRYEALGWYVTTIDGHDLAQIDQAFTDARVRKGQPTLIVAKTTIGKGSPNKGGTSSAHGAPLGDDEIKLTKEALGLDPEPFTIPDGVTEFFEARMADLQKLEDGWKERKDKWAQTQPDLAKAMESWLKRELPADFDKQVRALDVGENQASRKSSSAVLQSLHDLVPYLVGGSADLSCSDLTMMKNDGVVKAGDYGQRNIKYGVREFAMSAMTNGIAQQEFFLPFCGTFLTFSDYMRNAVRMASLMKLRVFYQFTHDSIGVGEDGPTHQPVEHVAALRAIPNLTVMRPADSNEVKAAWSWAIAKAQAPVAMILTRQGLPDLEGTEIATDEGVAKGAYVLRKEKGAADYCILATGSEVKLALDVADKLEADGKGVRVVSMPSWELFDAQDKAYQDSVLGNDVKQYVSIEMQVEQGWHKYIGRDGIAVCMSSFGTSAPGKDAMKKFGFTADQVYDKIKG